MGQQPLPQKWRLTCPSLSLSHFSSTGPATRVESSGEFIGFSLLLYMFHIRCIDNHTENSTSSRHSDHHSPSHRLFRPLPPTLSLLCLWRNKRTESRETQLTSWHTPARCSSPHPGKRKPLTGTHHTWPGCPPAACCTPAASSPHATLSTPPPMLTPERSTHFCLRGCALPAPGLVSLFPACLLLLPSNLCSRMPSSCRPSRIPLRKTTDFPSPRLGFVHLHQSTGNHLIYIY